jgi:hypothetical protein
MPKGRFGSIAAIGSSRLNDASGIRKWLRGAKKWAFLDAAPRR